MQKALFSSPFAALDSSERRIALLQAKPTVSADEHSEVAALEDFATTLRMIDASSFSKFQRLIRYLTSSRFKWHSGDPSDRLVIFSERIETLRWMQAALPQVAGLKAYPYTQPIRHFPSGLAALER